MNTDERGAHLAELDGPALFCPNHISHLDAPLVRQLLPDEWRRHTVIAAAADYFFGQRLPGAAVALTMGAFPFGRTTELRESLERVVDLVADGWSVIIFPEGTRSADGRLGRMREGIGLLASSTRVPVVPVHIAGAHELLPKGRAMPRRRRGSHVVVRFGPALRFLAGRPAHEVTHEIGDAIAALAGSG
jgi:1-acyl-sn-glycerol-3-phosphate acyltransferase